VVKLPCTEVGLTVAHALRSEGGLHGSSPITITGVYTAHQALLAQVRCAAAAHRWAAAAAPSSGAAQTPSPSQPAMLRGLCPCLRCRRRRHRDWHPHPHATPRRAYLTPAPRRALRPLLVQAVRANYAAPYLGPLQSPRFTFCSKLKTRCVRLRGASSGPDPAGLSRARASALQPPYLGPRSQRGSQPRS
jgi:hypothetical protein